MLSSLLAVDESRLWRLSHLTRSSPRHMLLSLRPEFCLRNRMVSRSVRA